MPRLEPAAGFDQPPRLLTDAEFTLATCALRLALPDVGIVLSTRETAPNFVTGWRGSASRTCPPGRARSPVATQSRVERKQQFEVADHRTAADVSLALAGAGSEPVWKDSSPAFRQGIVGRDKI